MWSYITCRNQKNGVTRSAKQCVCPSIHRVNFGLARHTAGQASGKRICFPQSSFHSVCETNREQMNGSDVWTGTTFHNLATGGGISSPNPSSPANRLKVHNSKMKREFEAFYPRPSPWRSACHETQQQRRRTRNKPHLDLCSSHGLLADLSSVLEGHLCLVQVDHVPAGVVRVWSAVVCKERRYWRMGSGRVGGTRLFVHLLGHIAVPSPQHSQETGHSSVSLHHFAGVVASTFSPLIPA